MKVNADPGAAAAEPRARLIGQGSEEPAAGFKEEVRRGPPGVRISVDLSSPWLPEDDILETFEFDHELAWRFWVDQKICEFYLGLLFIIGIIFLPCSLVELYFMKQNFADAAYNRWLAVSRDSIFIVRKRRKSGMRFDCQDIGEIKKLIPISNVQDVLIEEPAGTSVMCFVPNVLNRVTVQTAAMSCGEDAQRDGSQANLAGLKNPRRFRELIMGLKKGGLVQDGTAGALGTLGALGAQPPGGAASLGSQATLEQILETLQSIDRKLDNKVLVDAPPHDVMADVP